MEMDWNQMRYKVYLTLLGHLIKSASCGTDHMLWLFTIRIIFLLLHLTTGASASMSMVWMDYDPQNDEETWIEGDVWGGFTIYKNLKFALSNEGPEDEVICNSVNWIQVTIKFLFFGQLLTII